MTAAPQRPPRDGWLLVRAGETVVIDHDAAMSPHPQQLTAQIRQIRGAVLSASFDLESLVENCITSYFLGNDPARADRHEAMAGMILRDMRFEKKMQIVQDIFRRFPHDPAAFGKFSDLLGKARQVRNLMAHHPCWLEPVTEPDSHRATGFRAYISRGSRVWEITPAQAEQWLRLLGDAIALTEGFARALAGLPATPPAATPPGAPPPAAAPPASG